MPDPLTMIDRLGRLTTFATLGVMGTTQDLARTALGSLADADPNPELIAEETLCLTAVATARAAEVGLRNMPDVADLLVPTLFDLPFTYHDYLIGGTMIIENDPTVLNSSNAVYPRLQRACDFYRVHLPPHQFPGERMLQDKLPLWMGRISPPKLPESPMQRLERLNVAEILLTHLKLVLAFMRRGGLDR